ncbi:MAG: bacterial Ig-like domain-containing protein [Lachnospiraceae bacterium]|nr:bacterial Ig-like domain-containing protein [Lachnospiraceae bacterium]
MIERTDEENNIYYDFAPGYYYNLYISCLDDPDASQDMDWYNWMLQPQAPDCVTIDKDTLITQLVRDKIEAELTGGERGNSELIPGNYAITVVAGTYDEKNPGAGGAVARTNEYVIDLSEMAVNNEIDDIPEALYTNGKDHFRAAGEGYDRHWQSISDYYRDEDRPDGNVYRDNEGNLINFRELDEDVQEAYIAAVNAGLPEDERFVEKDTLDTYLLSSRGYDDNIAGYIVRLVDNRFTYNDMGDGSVMDSRVKGEEEEMWHNRETGMGGILERPVTDGKLLVAAIYWDGSISDWQYGRERHYWDEFTEENEPIGLVNSAGTISWNQENDDHLDIYIERVSDGVWFRADVGRTLKYDAVSKKGSFELGDLLLWMVSAKFQGWYDGENNTYVKENLINGLYRIRILRHPVADGEFDRVSKDDLRFNFDTSADRPAAFRANYNDRAKYVKVVQDGNGHDTWYSYETYDEPGEGRTEKKEYTIGIKDNDANIVGYIINLPDCDIMDVNREGSLRYSAVLAGNGKEHDNSAYTTKEWLFHDKDTSSEILIASVNADGIMSEWVSAVPSSRADEFETAVMGLNYNAVNGLLDAEKVILNALNASLSCYSKEGAGPEGDGYTPVAEAAAVFRGVGQYDAGTRLYRKNVNDYRIDSVNLPARAAADELMFAEGQKNIWDDENVHHEEPWRCLPGPGTYKASLVIWPQNGHDGATGLASIEEVSFTYRKGLNVEAPAAGSVTYSRDTNGNYNVHVTSPADDAVAYIVKYKRNSNDTMFTYEDRVADEYGNFGGGFGDGGRIYVCAVNRYGDISGFTEVLPEIENVAVNTLNTENCNKIYPVGFNGLFTLSGARVTARRYDTETSESVDIYELAEQTGGDIRFLVADADDNPLSGDDFDEEASLSVSVRLYGGRLNGDNNDLYKNLGTVSLQVKALGITSITADLSLDKESYYVGDKPVIKAGGIVTIYYSDGSTRVIKAPDEALSLYAYDYLDYGGTGTFVKYGEIVGVGVWLDGQPLLLHDSAEAERVPVTFTVSVNAVTTESITVTPPYKTTYFVGERPFDPDGGIVTVTKNNGKTEAKPLDVNWCEGFDYTTPGSKRITVHLDDKTATFTVDFVEPAVTGIRVFAPPKLSYIEGEAFDPTGGILTVSKEYEYGGPVAVDMSNQGVTVPDIRSLPPGNHEISIGYSGKTTMLIITIFAKKVNTVEFITRPDKSEYQPGEELDLTGGKIKVTYSNAGVSPDELDLPDIADELAISGFRNDVPGLYTVSVVYKGKTVTFDASVKGVTKLELTQAPAKLSYYAGQGLVPTGGKITAYFEDGSQVTLDITGDMLSGYDRNAPGRQTVKVTYGGRVVTFDVDVIAVAVDRIAVAPAPSKTEYICGEDLSVAGGKIRVTYNDGHEETIDITAAMVSGYDKDKEGAQTITVTYSGKTATFAVTVKPAEKPVPVVTTAPAAVTGLVADGTAKALITAGEATGGTLYYAVMAEDAAPAAEAYAKAIPTGTAAGTYYVWYFVKGADGYSDTEAVKLTVTIAAPADNPEPAVHKHSLKKHDRVEPTYDQAGSIEYWECTDPACKKIFADAAGTKEITAAETVLPRLLDYVNIPAETVPVVEEGTINDKPVKIETDVTYPGAVTWTGGKTTRDQLSVLAGNSQIARVSITGLEEAISKMKPGTDTGKLFTISYNIKGKAIGQGSFTIKIKLNSKALKKAGIKGNDKKALVELVKSLNEQLAKDVHTFEIVPIDLSDTQNVTITVKAKLKGGKVQVNEADNSIKKLTKLTITYKVPAGWKKGVIKTKKKTFTYKPSKVTGKFVITVTDPVARTADIIATADNTTFAGGRIGLTVKK